MALLDLPPELLELTLQLAVGELVDVPAVATLVTARAVCKSFRALLDGLFAPRLDGQSWEHLAIAVALKSCEDEEGVSVLVPGEFIAPCCQADEEGYEECVLDNLMRLDENLEPDPEEECARPSARYVRNDLQRSGEL